MNDTGSCEPLVIFRSGNCFISNKDLRWLKYLLWYEWPWINEHEHAVRRTLTACIIDEKIYNKSGNEIKEKHDFTFQIDIKMYKLITGGNFVKQIWSNHEKRLNIQIYIGM